MTESGTLFARGAGPRPFMNDKAIRLGPGPETSIREAPHATQKDLELSEVHKRLAEALNHLSSCTHGHASRKRTSG